jgi:hypothetical protein
LKIGPGLYRALAIDQRIRHPENGGQLREGNIQGAAELAQLVRAGAPPASPFDERRLGGDLSGAINLVSFSGTPSKFSADKERRFPNRRLFFSFQRAVWKAPFLGQRAAGGAMSFAGAGAL